MGASAGYARAINSVGIYGVPSVPTPNVGAIHQNPYLMGSLTFNGQTQLSTTPVSFDTLGATANDVKAVLVYFYNQLSQELGEIDLVNTVSNSVPIQGANPVFIYPGAGINAASGLAAYVVIPIMKPLQSGTIYLNFIMAGPTYGVMPYHATFICSDGGFLPAPATPITQTLTLASAVELIATPAISQFVYLKSIMAGNTSATQTRLDLSAGLVLAPFFSMPIAPGGGFEKKWDKPIPIRAPSNFGPSPLYGTLGVAVTDVRVNIEYAVGP